MNERAPECCKTCNSLTPEGYCVAEFRTCPKWRLWFRKEWAGIQKAAAEEKKNDKKEDPTK